MKRLLIAFGVLLVGAVAIVLIMTQRMNAFMASPLNVPDNGVAFDIPPELLRPELDVAARH